MPAKRRFCEARKVYQIGWSARPRARLKLTAFCTLSRRFLSPIDEAIARARSASSGVTSSGGGAGSSAACGSGPGAKRSLGTPSAAAISAPRWPSSYAQTESAVFTWTVPSLAIRAGHALRAIAGPTASGQRSTSSAIPACGPKRASSERISSASGSKLHLHQLGRFQRQRSWVRRRDDSLTHLSDALGENPPAAEVELGEHVVEQKQRRFRQELRL